MNDIQKILPLYFEGRLDERQSKIVEEWIESSDENKAIADDMASIYYHADALYAISNSQEEKALKDVNKRINRGRLHAGMSRLERVAAILFIPLLMFSAWQIYDGLKSKEYPTITISTNPGMTSAITLPDGTSVKLNSETRLSYPSAFSGKKREVELDGEAYFDVAKDGRHPFVVNTSNDLSITAYGTQFNVESYSNADITTSTLLKGRISMTYTDNNNRKKETFIRPGESIRYSEDTKGIKIWKGDADILTAWKDGKLIFRNMPVADVFKSLSKRFGVIFTVKNDAVYSNYFTGTLENQRLERILEYLSYASNINFEFVENGDLNQKKQQILVY